MRRENLAALLHLATPHALVLFLGTIVPGKSTILTIVLRFSKFPLWNRRMIALPVTFCYIPARSHAYTTA